MMEKTPHLSFRLPRSISKGNLLRQLGFKGSDLLNSLIKIKFVQKILSKLLEGDGTQKERPGWGKRGISLLLFLAAMK